MTSSESLAAHLKRRLRQESELHRLIAPHARIRRLPAEIGRPNVIQNARIPFVRKIEDPELDSQPLRRRLRLAQRLRLVRAPECHRHADDLVPLLLQEQCRNSGINTARNPDRNFHSVSMDGRTDEI